jgi:hypothetical protein
MRKGDVHVEETIGEQAGRLWQILKEKGPLTPSQATKVLGLRSAEVDRAIGWLAREGKLNFAPGVKGETLISLK